MELNQEQITKLTTLSGTKFTSATYKDLGCFNWALTGFAKAPVTPMDMFNYMNRSAVANSLGLVGTQKTQYEQLIINSCKNPSVSFDGTWFNTSSNLTALDTIGGDFLANRITKEEAIKRVMNLAIVANGLALASGPSNHKLSIYYIKSDPPSVQHVWLDVGGTCIEIFPAGGGGGMPVQLYRGWQRSLSSNVSEFDRKYGRIDFSLTGFHQAHINIIATAL
ncbi:MAG TPA: hypothetical protein VE057_00040 [Archangium sp.]|nr:hypothetical protein [Archangium sp.]